MSHRIAIIDPSAGVSGDMLLGALVSATRRGDWLVEIPRRLGLAGVECRVESVMRAGIHATKVTVVLPDGSHEGPGDGPGGHHGDHGHRHVSELIGLVESSDLPAAVRMRAVECFRRLAAAEGRVHGVDPSRVALHEVGAVDAVVDIVGVIAGFDVLHLLDDIYHWPPALGTGWVHAAHGAMPVPAPATALLLEGMAVNTTAPASGEATTPTGAVLLSVLSHGAPPHGWRLREAGHFGAGERNPSAYANVVRLLLADVAREAAEIVVLATDVDDMNAEYLEPLREALMGAGALDVQTWATMGKKGRISFRIEAHGPRQLADAMADAMFRHSTTAGVRVYPASRFTLERTVGSVTAEDGSRVRVKTVRAPNGPREKLEADDIQALARRTGRPVTQVARELHDQAARRSAGAGGRTSPNTKAEE